MSNFVFMIKSSYFKGKLKPMLALMFEKDGASTTVSITSSQQVIIGFTYNFSPLLEYLISYMLFILLIGTPSIGVWFTKLFTSFIPLLYITIQYGDMRNN